jgi:hypothetical protein
MFKTGFVIIMAMLAAKADPQNMARKAFNNCLVGEHNKAIDAKSSAADFNKTAQTACTVERKAYHDIIVKNERGFGSSAKEADEFANEEVQGIVDSITSAFSQNSEASSKMVEEK